MPEINQQTIFKIVDLWACFTSTQLRHPPRLVIGGVVLGPRMGMDFETIESKARVRKTADRQSTPLTCKTYHGRRA
jgi:hypothetical protein